MESIMANSPAENIRLMEAKIEDIHALCAREGRGLHPVEENLVKELEAAIHEERLKPTGPPLSRPGAHLGQPTGRAGGAHALRGPGDPKDYRSLFGDDGLAWTDRETNFFSAMFSGRHHPGLIRASMSETVPSDGGFLVPKEQAAKIHAVALESEIVQPRCYVQPMQSNSIKIPGMSIGSHASALFGGFTASYQGELGTINEADPKARSMELFAHKLTGLIRFSSELNADTPGGMSQIEILCGKGHF
jgi:HK97 family phage major capsid protein